MPRESCPKSKTPPNAVYFSLSLEDAPLLSFVASNIQRFFACPKKKKEREQMVTSHDVDAVNKVSLKDSPSKIAKAGSFKGCRPWIETQQQSGILTPLKQYTHNIALLHTKADKQSHIHERNSEISFTFRQCRQLYLHIKKIGSYQSIHPTIGTKFSFLHLLWINF